MGFLALGSTSVGLAFSLGRPDERVKFEQLLDHLSSLTGSTDLRLSADMKTLFAATANDVHMNVILAATDVIGGASIQDSSDDSRYPLLPVSLVQERDYAKNCLTGKAFNSLFGEKNLGSCSSQQEAQSL